MSALSIQPTYPIFTDIDGQPLEDGYVWIGGANLAPIGNPINVYWDAALTIAATQPIRTLAGYPSRNGTPARLYVNSDYSIQVQNRNGSTVYSATSATERYSGIVISEIDSADVSFIQSGTGAVTRTALSKMRDVYNVRDFGALGNGSHDDTAEIQAAITATPSGGVLVFPPGDYITSAALQINNPITIQGSQKNMAVILCLANDGLQINSVNNVNVYDLEIAQAIRYTTTANSYTGILITGDTVLRPFNHCYRDVYIDGFRYGIYADWIWSAVFDNVRTAFGQTGLTARYLCANDVVTNCSFSGDGTGYGINIQGLGTGTEGWMISNTLTYNNRTGIYGSGATHVYIANCILDYNYESGILIASDGLGNFGGNFSITNNYIAMGTKSGITGVAPIHIFNNVSNSQNRGCQISNNHILSYSGTTCPYGIFAEYAQGVNNAITGNSIKSFSTNDIRINADGGTITGNVCLSAITNNIQALGLVSNNTGTVYYQRAINYATVGKIKITYDEAVPTVGTWNQGDICFKENPAAGGVPGWVCVSAGTPGTWKAMAALAA